MDVFDNEFNKGLNFIVLFLWMMNIKKTQNKIGSVIAYFGKKTNHLRYFQEKFHLERLSKVIAKLNSSDFEFEEEQECFWLELPLPDLLEQPRDEKLLPVFAGVGFAIEDEISNICL